MIRLIFFSLKYVLLLGHIVMWASGYLRGSETRSDANSVIDWVSNSHAQQTVFSESSRTMGTSEGSSAQVKMTPRVLVRAV